MSDEETTNKIEINSGIAQRTVHDLEHLLRYKPVRALCLDSTEHKELCASDKEYWNAYCDNVLTPGLSAIERFCVMAVEYECFYSFNIIRKTSCALLISIWESAETQHMVKYWREVTKKQSIMCAFEKLVQKLKESESNV